MGEVTGVMEGEDWSKKGQTSKPAGRDDGRREQQGCPQRISSSAHLIREEKRMWCVTPPWPPLAL